MISNGNCGSEEFLVAFRYNVGAHLASVPIQMKGELMEFNTDKTSLLVFTVNQISRGTLSSLTKGINRDTIHL